MSTPDSSKWAAKECLSVWGVTRLFNRAARAACRIACWNVAFHKADYARFVEIATGSVFEVVSQATIGRNQGFLNQTQYEQLYCAAEKQSRMLSGLRKSLEMH